MAAYGKFSELPREVRVSQSAVPFSATERITSFDTDVSQIAFTNTTASPVAIKLLDGNSSVIGNFSAYDVPIGTTPFVVNFEPPLRATQGFQWLAQSTGLFGSLLMWTKADFTS